MSQISFEKSQFLDFLRWAAALIVVIGHIDMVFEMFVSTAAQNAIFEYASLHAHAAVMVFFVLSGYVVAFATENKSDSPDYTFREYYLDRWSRIFSVLWIAILLTLTIDWIGSFLHQIYRDSAFVPQDLLIVRLVANLAAVQGFQGFRMQLGTNSALWSIGYEFTYYIVFGLLYFRPKINGMRWLWCLIVIGILSAAGAKVAFYLLIWLLGVFAYRYKSSFRFFKTKINAFVYVLILVAANHYINVDTIFGKIELINDFLFATVFASTLLFDVSAKGIGHISNINRYLASFSYSLYATHLPIIFLSFALLTKFFILTPSLLLGFSVLTLCLIFARMVYFMGESRRIQWRAMLSRVLGKMGI